MTTSVSGAFALAASSTGVGLVLVGISVAAMVFIEIYKDTPVQTWLDQCVFSTKPTWHTEDAEMKALAQAVN